MINNTNRKALRDFYGWITSNFHLYLEMSHIFVEGLRKGKNLIQAVDFSIKFNILRFQPHMLSKLSVLFREITFFR